MQGKKRPAFSAALPAVAMLFFLCACGNGKTEETRKPAADSNVVYYPINDYIRRQIKDVDTTPYYLYRLTISDRKKDSAVVSRPAFDAEVRQFLVPELEAKALRDNFTESVFQDESTNSITLTYAPKQANGIVQNASVLLDKDDQTVKWIFINTLSSAGDSTMIQRITWKGNKSCTINTGISYKNKPETQRQLSFVWNEKGEE